MSLRNLNIELDDTIRQSALARAQAEGKTLETIIAELVARYAQGEGDFGLTSCIVQRGDTLSQIAKNVYGDAKKYPLIQKANNIADANKIWVGQVLILPLPDGTSQSPATPQPAAPTPSAPAPTPEPATPASGPAPSTPSAPQPSAPAPAPEPPKPKVDPCAAIDGQNYGTLPVVGPPTDRPAAEHGDINLALRGYNSTDSTRGLIDMAGPTDNRAPQLPGLFADTRTPEVSNVYQANNWDWGSNSRGAPVTDFDVTVTGFKVEAGETIHVPEAGYEIGQGNAVLVLYADEERITLKYTGEDSVVGGYAIHVDGVCTEPGLLALYNQMNSSGRGQLPALRAKQPFGRARGDEIQVAIRDTGRFMDPRVRKDWWRGR